MAQPSNVTYRQVKILDAAGAGVTGLTLASFTLTAWARAYGAGSTTAYSSAPALTSLGGGWYELAFALPPTAGWWRVTLEHATHRVWNGSWEGEVETQDWDSLYGSVVQPIATLSTGAQLGMPLTLELVASRWRTLSIPIKDSAGNLYASLGTDFPSASLRLGVKRKDGTSIWQAGPSGTISSGGGTPANFAISTSGNTLSVTIPEDATGIFNELAAGVDRVDLIWEVTGDYQNVAPQTQPIIRTSTLTVSWKAAP